MKYKKKKNLVAKNKLWSPTDTQGYLSVTQLALVEFCWICINKAKSSRGYSQKSLRMPTSNLGIHDSNKEEILHVQDLVETATDISLAQSHGF